MSIEEKRAEIFSDQPIDRRYLQSWTFTREFNAIRWVKPFFKSVKNMEGCSKPWTKTLDWLAQNLPEFFCFRTKQFVTENVDPRSEDPVVLVLKERCFICPCRSIAINTSESNAQWYNTIPVTKMDKLIGLALLHIVLVSTVIKCGITWWFDYTRSTWMPLFLFEAK